MYFGGSFTYGDYDSATHGLFFAHMDTSEMLTPVAAKSYSSIRNRSNERRYIQGSKYESPLSFDTEIFVCDKVLTDEESRVVCKTLFNTNDYKRLKLKSPEWNGIHLNCVMTLQEKITGSVGLEYGVVGYKINILCDAPFAWEDDYKIETKIIPANEDFIWEIINTTDYEKYTYPLLSVKCNGNNAAISIKNKSDLCNYERITAFNIINTDTIILDGEKSKITHEIVSDNTLNSTFSGYFLRLVRGTNELICNSETGNPEPNIEITIEFPIARWIV